LEVWPPRFSSFDVEHPPNRNRLSPSKGGTTTWYRRLINESFEKSQIRPSETDDLRKSAYCQAPLARVKIRADAIREVEMTGGIQNFQLSEYASMEC